MSTSFPSVAVASNDWTDVTAAAPGIASVDTFFQNIGSNSIILYFGGTSKPTATDGIRLRPDEGFQGNAAKVWARGADGQSRLAIVGSN